jgi:proteasome lid subunit RPN8/RPN11
MEFKRIYIPKIFVAGIASTALIESPDEICGAFVGHIRHNAIANVTDIIFIKNISPRSPKWNFNMDPQGYHDVLTKTKVLDETSDLEFLGIFHSHPLSHPYPSSYDKKAAEDGNAPEGAYAIFSGTLRFLNVMYLENKEFKLLEWDYVN